MKPPCMIVVKYLLPAIRAKIAENLVIKYNLKSKEVAEKLGLTEAAISQYINSKRGMKGIKILEKSEGVTKMIDELTYKIATKQMSFDEEIEIICNICKTLRKEGIIYNGSCSSPV